MSPSLVQTIERPALHARVHVLESPILARRGPQRTKRALDILLALALGIAALPVMAVIALAILIESGRPLFFAHTRIGKGGRRFRLWKFRSMVANGDEVLRAHLAAHPELAREWRLTHKLRNDPRVTRVGQLLRTTSLDELPQFWNVLRGDMSMVGPRPVVQDELSRYGPAAPLYLRVLPGLTGLWQVSGRNDTTYERRIQLDRHYIRHWSVALDALVLLKTVRVVLLGKGAY
jgi:Undecaprenyl-phosphate galactose phosphotransferase WbaP